ncbi:MAG: hypothetical protein P1U80_09735 [Pseudomonadales bacterium]|nr:hypothetical protein [Pseudomonadales bacterium]
MINHSRKILLTLNEGASNAATLDLVAEFAAAIHADIDGLFIEDKTLLDIAALPFTREIRAHGLQSGQLEVATLEHQMRMLSGAAQRELKSCAQRWKVQCSFSTSGTGINQWLGAEQHIQSTLCILHKEIGNWGKRSSPGGLRNGTSIAELLEKHPGPLMLLPRKQGAGRELIGIVHDQRSLKTVLNPIENLVKRGHQPVIILLCEDPPEAEKLKRKLIRTLTEKGLQASVFCLEPATQESLLQFINQHSPKLMILESNNPIIDHSILNQLIETARSPVLLLRDN